MRLALITATVVVVALTGMTGLTLAQNRDSCQNMCDCESLQCTDFCSTCTGACGRKFNAIVKSCRAACRQCKSLQKK
jgi:hypothetical protein